jgi:hypothetical protein
MLSEPIVLDGFDFVIANLFPLCMVIVYVLPILRITQRMVSEKASKIRELMLLMGLSNTGYWLCWFLYYLGVSTFISLICTLLLTQARVLPNSTFLLILLYMWLYGLSHFGYILLMQSLFRGAPRTASILTTLAFFLTSFLDQAVASRALGELRKGLASLLPTIAMSRAMQNIFAFEKSGMGLTTKNV